MHGNRRRVWVVAHRSAAGAATARGGIVCLAAVLLHNQRPRPNVNEYAFANRSNEYMTHLTHALSAQYIKDPNAPLQEELWEEVHAQLSALSLGIDLHRRLLFDMSGVRRVRGRCAVCVNSELRSGLDFDGYGGAADSGSWVASF